ncbi:MAG: SfnB family sulfur acquisition oxidoreductase [Solirubrobacteraceae bacterium]
MTVSLPRQSSPVRVITSDAEAVAVAQELAAAIADGVIERDRAGVVPRDALALLDQSGLLGITISTADGGAGVSPRSLAEVIRTIAAVDPSIAQVPQAHYLFVDVLRLWGTAEQRRRLYGDILAGARLGNALAERGAQHAQDLRTSIKQDMGGSLLDGRKYYCTGAVTARWIAVTALNDAGKLVVAFVGRDDEGVSVGEDWSAMGQRATVSGTTELSAVRVDPELVLEYWRAFEEPQLLGARGQLVHAAIEVGIAGGALRDAREFVASKARPFFEAVRGGWAERAADDPHTTLRFGRLATQLTAAEQLLSWAAGVLSEIGPRPRDEEEAARGSLAVAKAKAFGSETAVLIASELFALTGTSGTDERYDLHRHWRNARTHSVHDPVDWKYHHIGAYELSGKLPPSHGQL